MCALKIPVAAQSGSSPGSGNLVLLCLVEKQEIYFPNVKSLCTGCCGRAQESDCRFPDVLKEASETVLEISEIYMSCSPEEMWESDVFYRPARRHCC